MADSSAIHAQYGARVEALLAALNRGDEVAFCAALDELLNTRKAALFTELRGLTAHLQIAFERFRSDARLADRAETGVPDARQRLAHALKMTDEAAHRTLELVERSAPPAERTSKASEALLTSWKRFRARAIELKEFHVMLKRMDAFLPTARADAELIRRNLGEMLLSQGYQDLAGHILRSVGELVHELEKALPELGRLCATHTGEPGRTAAAQAQVAQTDGVRSARPLAAGDAR
jgi:chemotaxis protein CheZ